MSAPLPGSTRLSSNFRLSEFEGWDVASTRQLDNLEALVTGLLQPARDVFGYVDPSSWLRSAAEDPSGAHRTGAAVDFVPLEAPIPVVHRWMAEQLAGGFGELIDEGDHIHVTLPGVGGHGEVLYMVGSTFLQGIRPFSGGGTPRPFVLAAGALLLAAALLRTRSKRDDTSD